jgi:hypothetical protein
MSIADLRVTGHSDRKEIAMTLTTLLVILLVLVLIGALPVYPYSREWGYYPSGLLAVIVAVVALMLLL